MDKAKPNTQLIELDRILKLNYQLAIVTTASRKNTLELLTGFGIDTLFDLILTKEDVNKSKPDPEGFLKAMGILDANPDETIIFEDSDASIEAAVKTKSTVFIVRGFN